MEESQKLSKSCSSCNQEKELNLFHKQASSKDGYKYECKECCKAKNLSRYQVSKEKIIKSVRSWQETHKRKVNGYKKKYADKLKASSKVQETTKEIVENVVPPLDNNITNEPQQ